jgi:RNA polymerase sigma-70 factor (ECF subfamily)
MGEMESAPDASLVRRAQAGDSEAFGALVGWYKRVAYAVGLSVTGRHNPAEDAAQEGFMVALERLARSIPPTPYVRPGPGIPAAVPCRDC